MKLLIESGQIKELEANTDLLSVGDQLDFFIYVLEGEIKVYLTGPKGKRKTLYWIKKNESCLLGVNCLLNSTEYPANAMTTEKSKVIILTKKKFDELIENQKFRAMIFDMQSKRISETLDILKGFVFSDLEHRIAKYLIKRSSNGVINTTHLEASEDIGCSRERLSRVFKKFEELKLIKMLEKGKYSINSDKILKNYDL